MDRRPPSIAVDILSDDDESAAAATFSPSPPRWMKISAHGGGDGGAPPPQTLLVIDDDPTPLKQSTARTPSFVAETPLSSDRTAGAAKCTTLAHPNQDKFSGITGVICLESDNESEGSPNGGRMLFTLNDDMKNERNSQIIEQTSSDGWNGIMSRQAVGDRLLHADPQPEDVAQLRSFDGPDILSEADNLRRRKRKNIAVDTDKLKHKNEEAARKKQLKEEKIRLNEEEKQKKQKEKLQKEALKAEAAEIKKLEKEKQKWEKGKFAIKSIVAEIDAKIVENGSVGGHLLTRFADKGLSFRITSNPFERSILWKMSVPDQIAQVSSGGAEVPYILFVYQAEEFCNTVMSETLIEHVHRVRGQYPSSTICYLTNKLMSYVNKCEQNQYKNPSNASWKRPQVEEALSKLTTHFSKVHSRQCIDEAELAEHVVGLTSSLASCHFRKKPTWLSINANGSIVSKDFIDRNLIKKSLWLKALVAIPKVQPRYAIAISKKYPTMRSLLSIYMDPNKTVHEKEFLLKDLMIEGLLGKEDRRLGELCSKRVYRILMAQSGGIRTDDVEDGADFFEG